MSDQPAEPTPGFFDGLGEAIVREAKLDNLTALAGDRALWATLFVGGMALTLLAVPVVLAVYTSGVKRFHTAVADKVAGRVELEVTAVGFHHYPITVTGTYEGLPVSLVTYQKDLYKPMLASDYYAKRHTRVFTRMTCGTGFPGHQAFAVGRPGPIRREPPAGFRSCQPGHAGAAGWSIVTTDEALVTALFDEALCERLRDLDRGLPDLTLALQDGVLIAQCSGPLRGETAAAAVLNLYAFCRQLEQRLGQLVS